MRDRWAAHAPRPVAAHPARPPRLVVAVRATLALPVLDEALTTQIQAFRAVVRHGFGRSDALLFEPALRVAQPRAPALAGRQLRRQFVAARLAVAFVFRGIDAAGLLDDLRSDFLVSAVGAVAGHRRQLCAV